MRFRPRYRLQCRCSQRSRLVTGKHDDLDARLLGVAHGFLRFGTQRVGHPREADQRQTGLDLLSIRGFFVERALSQRQDD